MDSQKPTPITAQQLYELTLPEQRSFPLVWKKNIHIDVDNTSRQSKKYSLPFWPEKLKDTIKNILSKDNNSGSKLSFIFQLNLEEFYFPELPTKGILQFYCANNNLVACDYNEEDKEKFERIMCQKNTGVYQIIYIPHPYLSDTSVDAEEIKETITPYNEAEKAYSIKFKQNLFEVPLLNYTMYHKLQSLGYNTASIRQSFEEYIQENSKEKINLDLEALFRGKDHLFAEVTEVLYSDRLKSSFGNKCGGYPVYTEKDNRKKENSKFNSLLFQIDCIISQDLTETDIDDYEHSHKLYMEGEPYVMGLLVNKHELKKWTRDPKINFKENLDTLFYKQYFSYD